MKQTKWASTVVLVDADYLDAVAADMIVNFGRMIGRPIPQADLCHWLDCVALDSGLQPGDNQVQTLFLHTKEKVQLQNFVPSHFDAELDGKAFRDAVAEFTLQSFPVEEIVSGEEFFLQSLTALADAKEVNKLVGVAHMEAYGDRVKRVCVQAEKKDIMLMTMQPLAGTGFRQEILGYSLMSAMGIESSELQ